ncbi:MAG TPA: hypothetical protein VGJ99_09215 [Actinomycetota bacterium]
MLWPGLGHWKLAGGPRGWRGSRCSPGRSGLGSRALLWTSAGLVFLSVVIATFVTLPAARR